MDTKKPEPESGFWVTSDQQLGLRIATKLELSIDHNLYTSIKCITNGLSIITCWNQIFQSTRFGPMCPDTAAILIRKNVGIGYLNPMDSGPCVRTLCNNPNPAKMSESGIWATWIRAHVSRHCATILIWQKCWNWVFESNGLRPMCPETVQQF